MSAVSSHCPRFNHLAWAGWLHTAVLAKAEQGLHARQRLVGGSVGALDVGGAVVRGVCAGSGGSCGWNCSQESSQSDSFDWRCR